MYVDGDCSYFAAGKEEKFLRFFLEPKATEVYRSWRGGGKTAVGGGLSLSPQKKREFNKHYFLSEN